MRYFTCRCRGYSKEPFIRVLRVKEDSEMFTYANYSLRHIVKNVYRTNWKYTSKLNLNDLVVEVLMDDHFYVRGSMREMSEGEYKRMIIKEKLKS
jgi:hypothetical protein